MADKKKKKATSTKAKTQTQAPVEKKPEKKEDTSFLSRLLKMVRPSKKSPMLELVPVKGIQAANGKCIELVDGTYMDIIRIVTRDLMAISDDEFEYFVSVWTTMYRKMGFDAKLVSLNAPTDTRLQQAYIQHKLDSNTNPAFDRFLEEKLTQLQNIQRYRTDRQFYLIFFAQNNDDYRENLAVVQQNLINYDLAEEISMDEKLAVLEKLNNKSAVMQLKNSESVKAMYPSDKLKVQKEMEKKGFDPWVMEAIQPHGGLAACSERYLATGLGYEACISISDFPRNLDTCWLSRIMSIDGCVAVIDIHTEDVAETKKNINAGLEEQLRRADDAKEAADLKTATRRYQELDALFEDIELGEILLVLRVRIFISAPTFAECDQRVKDVLAHLDSIGYKASVYINETVPDFKSVYQSYKVQQEDPYAKDYARYGQPLESRTVADGIPFHFTNLADPCGTYLGTTSSNEGSVLFDMHNVSEMRTSYNGCCVGNMGSGKSTLLKKLIEDMAVRSHYIRGFDPTGEFETLVDLFGGAYLSLDGSAGILNMLEILQTSDEGENMCFVNHLAKMRTVFMLLAPNASQDDANAFEEHLQNFYMDCGLINGDIPLDEQKITGLPSSSYPILSDFVAYLERTQATYKPTGDPIADDRIMGESRRCDSIMRVFRNLLSSYGTLFDGHTSIDKILDRQIVYFNIKNLSKMKEEVFDVQLFLALSLCWDNCVTVGMTMKRLYEEHKIAWEDITRFEIFIDESHRIINTHKLSAVEQITVFAREARKYFGGIIAATQSIRDYVPEGSSSESINRLKTFFELCDYKFIFRQDSNVLPLMRQTFAQSLTDSEVQDIPTLKKGEMLLCLPGGRNIHMNVEITDYEKDIFSGGA